MAATTPTTASGRRNLRRFSSRVPRPVPSTKARIPRLSSRTVAVISDSPSLVVWRYDHGQPGQTQKSNSNICLYSALLLLNGAPPARSLHGGRRGPELHPGRSPAPRGTVGAV